MNGETAGARCQWSWRSPDKGQQMDDPILNAHELAVVASASNFATGYLQRHSRQWETDRAMPKEMFRAAADAGLCGLLVRSDQGGQGIGISALCRSRRGRCRVEHQREEKETGSGRCSDIHGTWVCHRLVAACPIMYQTFVKNAIQKADLRHSGGQRASAAGGLLVRGLIFEYHEPGGNTIWQNKRHPESRREPRVRRLS